MKKTLLTLASCLLINAFAIADDNPAKEGFEVVFSNLALDCIHKEYSNKIAHFINNDEDIKPPRELYPAFYGCFDWHSSVHGHWLLVRMLNTSSDKVDTQQIITKLNQSFSVDNIAGELANYQRKGMKSFERPYGIAWLFQLTAELRQSTIPQAEQWLANLLPLEQQMSLLLRRLPVRRPLTSCSGKTMV